MRTTVKHVLWGALIAGGISLLGATAANAAETGGDDSLLGGSQAVVHITSPISINDNAIAIVGDSDASDTSTAAVTGSAPATESDAHTDGSDGTASGSQVVAPVTAPVNVSG
ncbi:chaplin family protein, partial [Microbacterium sp.]|uniref:chaplin family protein n=1 Tax=Microbacterium sp. TaxID=51671 RepID=UPI0028120FA4